MKKHNKYESYFLDMMKIFDEGTNISEPTKKLDDNFRQIFADKLISMIKNAWYDHKNFKRDTYILTEDELDIIFTEAKEESVSMSLMKLSDLDLIQTGINATGEIVYSLTEKGRALADSYDKYL
tara:strand:+ start:569 stop:940 length:372 start_codon:yes stop_codon:yes gene_type:complete